MLHIYTFFSALLTAFLVENTVFSRALGLTKPALSMRTTKDCLHYGATFTWMLFFSSIGAWIVNWVLYGLFFARYTRAFGFLLAVGGVYLATNYLLKHKLPERLGSLSSLRRALPLTTFNSALFGALYININKDFIPTLGYAIGTGIGYTFAALVILYIRKSLAARPVPRAFRGLPSILVYIGLLSLGIYGLIGHGLPT